MRAPEGRAGGVGAVCRTAPAALLQTKFTRRTQAVCSTALTMQTFLCSMAPCCFPPLDKIERRQRFLLSSVMQYNAFNSNFLVFCQRIKSCEKGSC